MTVSSIIIIVRTSHFRKNAEELNTRRKMEFNHVPFDRERQRGC